MCTDLELIEDGTAQGPGKSSLKTGTAQRNGRSSKELPPGTLIANLGRDSTGVGGYRSLVTGIAHLGRDYPQSCNSPY